MKSISSKLMLALVVLLSACGAKENQMAAAPVSAVMEAAPAPPPGAASFRAGAADKSVAAPTQRFIALSHQLTVEAEGDALQKVFEDTIRRCEAAGCEVLSSSLTRGNRYMPPSASLSARIPPKAVDGFLGGLEKEDVKVIQHQRQAEDKTGEVVDAEARIANLTELRDRLRVMLASRPGGIKDVLEVERELAETQSKLDGIRGVRKALANETEKVALNIQFQSRQSIAEQGALEPVISAWHQAGRVLMGSVGGLITFIAAVLPWMLAIAPVGWGLRALWRKRKAKRALMA